MAGADQDWSNPAIINNEVIADPPDRIVVRLGNGEWDVPDAGKDKAKAKWFVLHSYSERFYSAHNEL